jgi:hypothetical protein
MAMAGRAAPARRDPGTSKGGALCSGGLRAPAEHKRTVSIALLIFLRCSLELAHEAIRMSLRWPNAQQNHAVKCAPPNSGEKKASHEDPAELKMDDRIGAEAAVASRYVCNTTCQNKFLSTSSAVRHLHKLRMKFILTELKKALQFADKLDQAHDIAMIKCRDEM